MILSLDIIFAKSSVLIALTVLDKIFKSSFSSLILVSNTSLIFSVSLGLTRLFLVAPIPINTLTKEVIINTNIILPNILPNLLGCFILPIDVVIVKNINGTIIVNKRLINKSPNGLNTFVFSPNIKPIIAPIMIDANNIIVDL